MNAIAKLLNYSFNPINWDYDQLTSEEKSLVTRKEFAELKSKYAE